MGPNLDPEKEEAPICHVDQHRLIGHRRPPIPADPRGDIVDPQREDHDYPLEITELSRHAAGEDRLSGDIEGGRAFWCRRHGITPVLA